ncbi:MAG: DMT family transporter [Actinobacteria bacterium]|nr:DMT family transporter [Actinomycetota bacterium]
MTTVAPAPTTTHMTTVDWARWAVPGLVWGTSFFFIAEGLEAFPAALITPMRVLFGFLTLACFPAARNGRIEKVDRRRVALLGVIWMAIPLSLFPFAEQHVSSSVTGMLNGATPIFVTTVAAFMAHKLPRRQAIVGLAIGFLGVVLIALPSGGDGDNSWFGIGLIFIALVFYGFALNVAVPLQQKYGSIPLMWRVQGVAFALTAPFAVPSLGDVHFTWSAFWAVVALGSLGTALAYVTMAANAGRLGSSRASASVYLIPVVSLLLGALVRHETVVALSVVGCAVALVGAYLATSTKQRI